MPMFRVAGIFNFYLRNEGAPNGARLPVLAIARSDANDVKQLYGIVITTA